MDKISTLWQGASYQDNLLQSYRSFHLNTQSIFIAIGVGLTIALITVDVLLKQLSIYALLILISGLGIYLLSRMRKLITARGEDVDYYHNKIIEHEKNLPKDEKVLTAFKVYQKFSREQINVNEYFQGLDLNENVLNQLTDRGNKHTRRFLDTYLFNWFKIIWVFFHLIAIFVIVHTTIKIQ